MQHVAALAPRTVARMHRTAGLGRMAGTVRQARLRQPDFTAKRVPLGLSGALRQAWGASRKTGPSPTGEGMSLRSAHWL